jgi:hypothetical protein
LLKGTTAFVPRGPARLYVRSFRGNSNVHCNIRDINDFKHFLSQLPSVQLVDSEDDADLAIDASVASFTEDEKKLIGIIPTKYACTTTLFYSLYDENTGQYIARNKVLTGSADVSVSKVTYLGLAGAILAYRKSPALGLGVLIATAVNAVHKIRNAARICPPVSIRQAFNNLTQDISNAADFSARVTNIDYERGQVTLNIGSNMGVRPSTPDQPFEFRIALAGTPLGDANASDGRHADFYDAVVRSVTPDSCVCEFQHVEGLIQGENGVIPSNPDKDMLEKLPDPSTGLISAQATVNFPAVNVFSDNDITQMKMQLVQWGDGVKSNPQPAQQEAQQQNGGSFLDRLLKH